MVEAHGIIDLRDKIIEINSLLFYRLHFKLVELKGKDIFAIIEEGDKEQEEQTKVCQKVIELIENSGIKIPVDQHGQILKREAFLQAVADIKKAVPEEEKAVSYEKEVMIRCHKESVEMTSSYDLVQIKETAL